MKRVRILHSRTRLGNKGDVVSVTDDRFDFLLSKGLVELVKEEKSPDAGIIRNKESQSKRKRKGDSDGTE